MVFFLDKQIKGKLSNFKAEEEKRPEEIASSLVSRHETLVWGGVELSSLSRVPLVNHCTTAVRHSSLTFCPLSPFPRHALHCLENTLHRINEDLQLKLNSLALEEQCLKSRERLTPKQTSMDRNMTLTGISRGKSALFC